jgi:tetratricopeptide (TPR) repeat protein
MAGSQEAFQQAMNQGHSAAWDQMWDRAAAFYRAALEEFPDHPQALMNLGLTLIELQEFDQALSCYKRAARASMDDPLPLERIAELSERMGNLEMAIQASLRAAELYLKQRDVNKAIENWERVSRLDPENLQAHSRLALVFERLGDKSKAADEYLAVASILQNTGDNEKAMRAVEQVLKIAPNNEEAARAMSLLRDFKPLPRPARPHGATAPILMSQVRQLQPSQNDQPDLDPITQASQKALTTLAGMLFETDKEPEQPTAGRKGLQALVLGVTGNVNQPVERTPIMTHLSQAVNLQTRGELSQAAEELQKSIEAGLEHPAAHFDLGYLFSRLGQSESALRQLQNAVMSTDYSLGTRLLTADLYREKGQIREAAFEYLEALKIADVQMSPPAEARELSQLYELLIESHRQQNDPKTQAQLCDNIHDMLSRPDWRAQLQRARQQFPGRGKNNRPIPLAEILAEARSSQVIESMTNIYDLVRRGCLRTAMEEAYYTLQFAPTYLPLHSLMGEMLAKGGNVQEAVAKLQTVVRTYSMRGETQQAVQYSRRVVELSPTDQDARMRLIEQLRSLGQIEMAIDEYMLLAEMYYGLADLNMARKTYMEALRAAQQANTDRTLRVKLLHRVADIDIQSLDWRQAIRVLEQIRTLQPEDVEARSRIIQLNFRLGQEQQALAELDNYLAYMSSQNQQAKSVPFLEELVADYSDSISMRRRLAEAYRQTRRYKDAVSQLDAIGEMLIESGEQSAAIQVIETIISMEPPNKEEYLELLRSLKSGRE